MNIDYDTVPITIWFENGSDDPKHPRVGMAYRFAE